MRILLDTNVLVSALLSSVGPPGQVLDTIRRDRHVLVSSTYLTDELRAVCGRRHLKSRILPEELDALIFSMEAAGFVTKVLPTLDISRDPKDNPIIATALAGNADLIVSGDKSHMQSLGYVRDIPVVTPREALKRLRAMK